MSRDVLIAMAGSTTNINIITSFFADIKFAATATLAGFVGLWGYLERRNRQKTVERLHARIKQLEQKIDPNRTSSGLTSDGRTNPRDMW
jgi:cation transport ATPase